MKFNLILTWTLLLSKKIWEKGNHTRQIKKVKILKKRKLFVRKSCLSFLEFSKTIFLLKKGIDLVKNSMFMPVRRNQLTTLKISKKNKCMSLWKSLLYKNLLLRSSYNFQIVSNWWKRQSKKPNRRWETLHQFSKNSSQQAMMIKIKWSLLKIWLILRTEISFSKHCLNIVTLNGKKKRKRKVMYLKWPKTR